MTATGEVELESVRDPEARVVGRVDERPTSDT